MADGDLYAFGPFVLDPRERRLMRGETPVPLTPKCFDLLVVLIENRGQLLTKNRLMETLWPDRIVEEGNLSFNISELRRALGEGVDGVQYIETVRKQGFRFVAPVTVPEPVAQKSPGDRRRWLIPVVLSVALLALLPFLTWPRRETPRVRTIAVLPFKPISANARDEALELGMADTLITRLGAVRSVTVRPLSEVRRFVNPDQDPLAAARQLDVDAVIDGSIQRAAERVRVNVRLTRLADARLLWSGTYDQEFTDIFAVQDAISEQVTRGLSLRLTDDEESRLARHETRDPNAYLAYLEGRFRLGKRSEESIRSAIESFRRAAAQDPSYAAAYSGLADSYSLLSQYADVLPSETFPAAKEAALQAMAIDDTLAEAHTSRAYVAEAFDWDWETAEREYRRALALDPSNAGAHHRLGVFLAMRGRFDEALREVHTARRLDPLSVIFRADAGMVNYLARRHDVAIGELRQAIAIEPTFVRAHANLAECLAQTGNLAEAVREAETVARLSGGKRSAILAYVYAVAGRKEDASQVLRSTHAVQPFYAAATQAALGDFDSAFAVLEQGYEHRADMIRMGVDPSLDSLRKDPRFAALVARVGLK
jgi:DNA-binding winged helix-turn-helix (wHTH) protein/TolB-like protein/Tfp pilus assembly protein PilF